MAAPDYDSLGNSFTILRVTAFPELPQDEKYVFTRPVPTIEDEQRCKLWRAEDQQLPDPDIPLEVFYVEHETPTRQSIRVGKHEARGFLFRKRFKAYLYREDSIMLCHTSKVTAWDFQRLLSKHEIEDEDIALERHDVLLGDLLKAAEGASGAWFKYAETDQRRATAIFADNMEHTAEFKKALADGKLSALHFDYEWEDDIIRVAVSARGTIQVLESKLNADQQLAVALRIWAHYLEPLLKKANKGGKKKD